MLQPLNLGTRLLREPLCQFIRHLSCNQPFCCGSLHKCRSIFCLVQFSAIISILTHTIKIHKIPLVCGGSNHTIHRGQLVCYHISLSIPASNPIIHRPVPLPPQRNYSELTRSVETLYNKTWQRQFW